MTIFITEMLRWGVSSISNDIIGIYSTIELANEAGQVEVSWRQGEYTYRVIEKELDPPISDERLARHNECKITQNLQVK